MSPREAVERFRQEGRLAGTLAHLRCVFVLGADEAHGRPYIVMELMPGSTLQTLIRERGSLEPEEAVAKILDVIEGLRRPSFGDHSPRRQAVELLPRRRRSSESRRFRSVEVALGGRFEPHENRRLFGDAVYASPEQIRRDPVDARTDVYSAAATLYYLLVGRVPFQHEDAAAAMARIVSEPAPSIRDSKPNVSRALDQVVLRGLERDPQKRWRSLDEFRPALLPFSVGHLSIAGLGLRLVAYAIDLALLLTLGAIFAYFRLRFGSIDEPMHRGAPFYARLFSSIQAVLWLAYFVPMDGLLGWTLGSGFMRLRVWKANGPEPPGMEEACAPGGLLWTGGLAGAVGGPDDPAASLAVRRLAGADLAALDRLGLDDLSLDDASATATAACTNSPPVLV